MEVTVTETQMASAFNEWMRRFTEEPEQFEVEFRAVGLFLQQQANGQEPTYGHNCAAYLLQLIKSRPA